MHVNRHAWVYDLMLWLAPSGGKRNSCTGIGLPHIKTESSGGKKGGVVVVVVAWGESRCVVMWCAALSLRAGEEVWGPCFSTWMSRQTIKSGWKVKFTTCLTSWQEIEWKKQKSVYSKSVCAESEGRSDPSILSVFHVDHTTNRNTIPKNQMYRTSEVPFKVSKLWLNLSLNLVRVKTHRQTESFHLTSRDFLIPSQLFHALNFTVRILIPW